MLAIKKKFEAITNLKKENLSFDDYLHLKEVVKALSRTKTVACRTVVFTKNEKVAHWIMTKAKLMGIEITPCGTSQSEWALNWR